MADGSVHHSAKAVTDDALEESCRSIFGALDQEGDGRITKKRFVGALRDNGLRIQDKRMSRTAEAVAHLGDEDPIDYETFKALIDRENVSLIERAVKGEFVIPDFKGFAAALETMFEETRAEKGGRVATYIPQLARVSPEHYALAVCTIDGQVARFGDWDEIFCVQSVCKPVNYAIALQLHGEDRVHGHVGREPSGQGFNEIVLNRARLPHNPMINAGAIMCASLIKPEESIADRFDYITEIWRAASGDRKPGFANTVYHSEKDTADRNFALAHFMKEQGAFPPDTSIHRTLDLYFQCCAIETDVDRLAVVAATFANAGACPLTDKKVFSSDTVKDVLSLMLTCGMYDFSGEFAFTVGLPAKSGVSGVLMIVVPNVCGIAIWSPRLDELGNSVRGVAFARKLVERFNFHQYDSLVELGSKTDPRNQSRGLVEDPRYLANSAAALGDLNQLRRLCAYGVSFDLADYDGRTPLHLAASEGHERVVAYLLRRQVNVFAKDRWGATPLDDAKRVGDRAVIALLEAAMAARTAVDSLALSGAPARPVGERAAKPAD